MTDETGHDLTMFSGEVSIAGSISFSSYGSDFSKIKAELEEFINDHRSDSDQWKEAALSEEEKSQGIQWKKVHKQNSQEMAIIRMDVRS